MGTSKGSILVIDDDRGILEIAERVLRASGYEVAVASTLKNGLARAGERAYDLILLDVALPDGSGLTGLRSLKDATKAPIVMMSGHVDSELAKDAMLLGAKALVAKPFDLGAFCDAIPRYLAK